MADNSYAQLIDDFEKGLLVIKGESLTDYIKRMGGVDYDAKANGGLMYLKKGGKVVDIMPKSMSWKGKAKDYPGIHEVIKQNRKKKTGPGVQKKADGGLMSPEEYFKGKEKYMKEEQIENMRREYNDYLHKQKIGPRDEAANGGIMGYANGGKTKQAKNLLNKKAPKGEQLAYINSKEANLLKRMGGAGIDVNGTGIKSYMSLGNEQQMNENLSAAGGGPGGSQNQSSGDNDPYQQQIATNTAIAKSRNPTITDSNDSVFNTIKKNVYNSPFKTKGIGRTLGYLLGNIFMPGIGGLLGGYLGGKKATSMANKFNLNKENLAEVPNITPFYDYVNTVNPVNKDISIINKDINNIDGQMAKVTNAQYNTLKSLGQVGNKGGTKGGVKELVPPGAFDSITDKEWEQIFRGDTRKQVVTGANGGLATMFRQKR